MNKQTKRRSTLIPILLLMLAQYVQANTITPEFIRNLPAFSEEMVNELQSYENNKLAKGLVTIVERTTDKYGVTDIAYGVTHFEILDAKQKGFLPKDATLPDRMTKAEADRWMREVTIPTYRAIVREVVTVPLSLDQEAALTFFTQNAGRTNLKKLVTGENRLNDGNYDSVISKMPLYYQDKDLRTRCKFHLAVYEGKPFIPKT